MLKQLIALLLTATVAAAQPFPARPGPVIISQPGTGGSSSSGGVDTNAVIALIEQYATGGGVVSNTVVQLTVDTWYTNGEYPLVVEAQIELNNSSALMLFSVKDTNSAVIGYLPGSAAWNEFGNASKYAFANTTATEDNVQSLGGYVPAYAAFRYYASGTTASIYDNSPNGTRLVYFGSGTNNGSGTIPDGSISTNKIDSTFYNWVAEGSGSVSPSQVAAIMATNYAASDNMSAAMFYVNTKLANRQPISIFGYGDNQIVNVGAGGGFNESVIAGLGTYLGRGGTKITSPTYVYSGGNGTFTAAVGTDALSHFGYWRMANGNSFTNLYASGAPDTSHLLLSYLDGTGFGSSAIWTNGAGTWGLCRTIPAASGTVRWNTTNISLGSVISTLTVAVVSSGTNVVAAVGQYNTNSTKYVYDKYFVGNGDINTMMTNSTTSNQLFTVLNNYDLFVVADISSSNTFYNGCRLLNQMITNNGFTVGVVIASGAPALDSPTTLTESRNIRIAAKTAAQDFGFGLLDTYGMLLPDTTNHLDAYFNDLGADRIHYDSKTSRALGALFIEESGLESSLKESLLYTNTAVGGKANLAGGNVFSGNQVIGGYLLSTGTLASLAFNYRTDNTRQFTVYGSGNGVFFADSAESNPWMVKSNASGTMSLNFAPYGGAAVFNFGNSSFIRYWGDGASLTNLLFKTNYVAAEFAPTSGYIKFVGSNNALYAVSATKTNLISAP